MFAYEIENLAAALCTLYPAPCTLHPAPCTLHPAPCTLHPAPCTLHPAPCTLHPATWEGWRGERGGGRVAEREAEEALCEEVMLLAFPM